MLGFLQEEHLTEYAFCNFSQARVIAPGKLERLKERWGTEPESVLVFLVPYGLGRQEPGNISVYARSRDYHLYFQQLFARLEQYFLEQGRTVDFCGYGDNSPVDEIDLAWRAGLGVRGKNGLLIHSQYGSYVFVGEIFFRERMPYDHSSLEQAGVCSGCGACQRACPTGCLVGREDALCLSAVSQQKRLSPSEEELLKKHGVIWGCDLCQTSCPMNLRAKPTPLSFFTEDRVPRLDRQILEELIATDRFSQRAFAWRGEQVCFRNLALQEKNR